MVLLYVGMWMQSVGGIRGMHDDESYPVSLVIVPVTGLLVSALIFAIAVLPIVQLARWIVRKDELTIRKGAFMAFWISLLAGGFLGILKADFLNAIMGSLYLGFGTLVFWTASVKDHVKQAGTTPVTRPESKPEGSDKPQSEAERRFR
ncbi:MAG TPA: hypothetical protein VF258_07145 [Luteolibacter sp.]